MLDFFLHALSGRARQEGPRVFNHLQAMEGVPYNLEQLQCNGCRIDLVNREGEVQLFEDGYRMLILFGYCFTKVLDSHFTEKTALSARDLALLYVAEGERFVNRIKGSFVVVLIDKQSHSIQAFTDPLNLKSAYYSHGPDGFLVSSSLTAIVEYLKAAGQPPKFDARALMDWYLFDFILDDHTYFEGVREVPPGAILRFAEGHCEIQPYFDPFEFFKLDGPKYDRPEGIEALKDMLSQNIRLYSEGPEHTAMALTGGFDSRSIAALLGEDLNDYQLFSYGVADSWDVKIPGWIAERLSLDYTAIPLNSEFERAFPACADLAVELSDGQSWFGNANISYVYQHFLQGTRSILTGLFGSELIKIPSSRGIIFDQHEVDLLNETEDRMPILKRLLQKAKSAGVGLPFEDGRADEEWLAAMEENPYFSNTLPVNQRFFYYLLMVAMRKYFRNEIRIQSAWKVNRHPYFDLEFMQVLLATPFPWVYNFAQKKSLVKNIKIHKLYGTIINQNPSLADVISTHGYKPKYVLHNSTLPMLALEFLLNKRKISAATDIDWPTRYSMRHIRENRQSDLEGANINASVLEGWATTDKRNYMKLSALQYWLRQRGLSL